jgi:chromosome segregation ATPase
MASRALPCTGRKLCKSFSNNTESNMADDAGAKARLEAAVQRLETALGRVAGRDSSGAEDIARLRQELGSLDSELAAARAERDSMAEELTRTRAEGASLQAAMDAVSARLDTAINSVHALLDE